MDWADEIAAKLDSEAFSCGGGGDYPCCSVDQSMIAAALRKAKADGMKEAAQAMDDIPSLVYFTTTINAIRLRANQIEKGKS